MGTAVPLEKISFDRPKDLPGVEIVRADHTTQCLRLFNQNYMVNTNLFVGNPRKYGKGLYRGKMLTGQDGDTLFAEPGEIYNVKYISDPVCFRALFISPETFEKTAREMGSPGPRVHFKMAITDHHGLFMVFKNLHLSLEKPHSALERQSRWTHCLHLLLEVGAEKAPPPSPKGLPRKAISRAVEFLHANSTEDISLKDIAAGGSIKPFPLLAGIHARNGRAPPCLSSPIASQKGAAIAQVGDQSLTSRDGRSRQGVRLPGLQRRGLHDRNHPGSGRGAAPYLNHGLNSMLLIAISSNKPGIRFIKLSDNQLYFTDMRSLKGFAFGRFEIEKFS